MFGLEIPDDHVYDKSTAKFVHAQYSELQKEQSQMAASQQPGMIRINCGEDEPDDADNCIIVHQGDCCDTYSKYQQDEDCSMMDYQEDEEDCDNEKRRLRKENDMLRKKMAMHRKKMKKKKKACEETPSCSSASESEKERDAYECDKERQQSLEPVYVMDYDCWMDGAETDDNMRDLIDPYKCNKKQKSCKQMGKELKERMRSGEKFDQTIIFGQKSQLRIRGKKLGKKYIFNTNICPVKGEMPLKEKEKSASIAHYKDGALSMRKNVFNAFEKSVANGEAQRAKSLLKALVK